MGGEHPFALLNVTGYYLVHPQSQLCRIGTDVPAVFSYAGLFADADDYETGNLVMGNNAAPAGTEEDNM